MFLLKKILLPLVGLYVLLGVVAAGCSALLPGDEYAAVLISNHAFTSRDYWVSPLAFLGSYVSWTFYFTCRGMKIEWTLGARRADLERVIRDARCQSIVLVGHGSRNCWQATDTLVTNHEVEAAMVGSPRKRGEWLQLTCGVEDTDPVRMGELAMEGDRVFTHDSAINFYALVADALSGFYYLKHANRP